MTGLLHSIRKGLALISSTAKTKNKKNQKQALLLKYENIYESLGEEFGTIYKTV